MLNVVEPIGRSHRDQILRQPNLHITWENSIFCGRRSMYGFYEIDSPSH